MYISVRVAGSSSLIASSFSRSYSSSHQNIQFQTPICSQVNQTVDQDGSGEVVNVAYMSSTSFTPLSPIGASTYDASSSVTISTLMPTSARLAWTISPASLYDVPKAVPLRTISFR